MDKILIVDDNEQDRVLLEEILTSAEHNYQICQADSAARAFMQIDDDPPDLILLDIQMEDIDGFGFLKELKKQKKDFIPVLLVSAFTGDNDRLKGIELGATDFINKPLIGEEVQARVAAHIRLKKMHDKNRWVAEKTNEGIKLLYKELENKNNELQRLDKLKSDFVSTVSHEIRTPLGISTHGLSLILDGLAEPVGPKTLNILNSIQGNLDRLNMIINDLLDISKIEEGRMDLRCGFVNINRLFKDLYNQYKELSSSKKIKLVMKPVSEDNYVYVDEGKILQVMNNLLNNAVKFSKDDGAVIEVGLNTREHDIVVYIKDNGIGISEKDFGKLFGKFQQLSRKEGPGMKGTGLGLAITKALIELHGGKIWATSREGLGTTFYFTLPRYEELKKIFEDEINVIVERAKQKNKQGCFITAEMKQGGAVEHRIDEKSAAPMNDLLTKIRDIVTRPNDRIFVYDFNTIHIVLPETAKEGGNVIIDKMRKCLGEDIDFGLAVFPEQASTLTEIVEHAKRRP